MPVSYGSGARMKFSTTRRLCMYRDLSIRDGKTGWGIDGGGENTIHPIMSQQLSRFVHVARRRSFTVGKHDNIGRLRRARHQVDSTAD